VPDQPWLRLPRTPPGAARLVGPGSTEGVEDIRLPLVDEDDGEMLGADLFSSPPGPRLAGTACLLGVGVECGAVEIPRREVLLARPGVDRRQRSSESLEAVSR
jgi:hypothetical protein